MNEVKIPDRKKAINITLTITTSILKYSAIPPQTPAIFLLDES